MGSIGSVMAGSGLEQVFGLTYGADTVQHVMSGKAYARAVRTHCLLEGALYIKLLHHIILLDNAAMALTGDEPFLTEADMNEIKSVISEVWLRNCPMNDDTIEQHTSLNKVQSALQNLTCHLTNQEQPNFGLSTSITSVF